MADIAAITAIIAPIVEDMGFKLVRVKMIGGAEERTLQIMAERPDTRQLTIEDCTALSHAIDEPLEAADPIAEPYRLEVSSPGIDRPLTRLADFSDWSGHEARITLTEKLDGRRKYKGVIDEVEGETVLLTDEQEKSHRLPFSQIEDAKLLLTDRLIQETQPLSTEGADTIKEEG
ncbi:ribosome maturation protein RimP [Sphingomicrobium lutaoense]|uniref:ribosome maturation protein RimP n=1 Tax=Sphingomicrobium lutaoense TaxID=515949 RepID=UPI0016211A92|nr:ribosome maturation protein RimP [Sphingomicrobium lutaoense]